MRHAWQWIDLSRLSSGLEVERYGTVYTILVLHWAALNHTAISFLRNIIPLCLEDSWQGPRPRTTSLVLQNLVVWLSVKSLTSPLAPPLHFPRNSQIHRLAEPSTTKTIVQCYSYRLPRPIGKVQWARLSWYMSSALGELKACPMPLLPGCTKYKYLLRSEYRAHRLI